MYALWLEIMHGNTLGLEFSVISHFWIFRNLYKMFSWYEKMEKIIYSHSFPILLNWKSVLWVYLVALHKFKFFLLIVVNSYQLCFSNQQDLDSFTMKPMLTENNLYMWLLCDFVLIMLNLNKSWLADNYTSYWKVKFIYWWNNVLAIKK